MYLSEDQRTAPFLMICAVAKLNLCRSRQSEHVYQVAGRQTLGGREINFLVGTPLASARETLEVLRDSPALRYSVHHGSRGWQLALAGLSLATLGGLALGAAGVGYRDGWWPLSTAFSIFKWGAYGGAAGAASGVAGALMGRSERRTLSAGMLGVVVGSLVWVGPWRWQQTARTVPRIHDITTDLADPPAFVAILPRRANAPNKAVYGGPAVAAAQRIGYPDIAPAMLTRPSERAFSDAEQVARAMKWEVVSSDLAHGLIEATDTTPWFGFKDDVVIRVRPSAGGSRVDVRSVSRVGGSDVGTNARRIREFLRRLTQETAASRP